MVHVHWIIAWGVKWTSLEYSWMVKVCVDYIILERGILGETTDLKSDRSLLLWCGWGGASLRNILKKKRKKESLDCSRLDNNIFFHKSGQLGNFQQERRGTTNHSKLSGLCLQKKFGQRNQQRNLEHWSLAWHRTSAKQIVYWSCTKLAAGQN